MNSINRFLTLWNGIGDVTANRVIEQILTAQSIDNCIQAMKGEAKIPASAVSIVEIVRTFQSDVAKAVSNAVKALDEVLSDKYKNQEWDMRRKDFRLVEKLAEKHSSILGFIEEYILDPVYVSKADRTEADDAVTIITIHSAKGTESNVCYVINVSPGAYPLQYAQGNSDDVEEERRILYVALTRAKNELIVTRQGYRLWAVPANLKTEQIDKTVVTPYFLNTLPDGLFEDHFHAKRDLGPPTDVPQASPPLTVGIKIG